MTDDAPPGGLSISTAPKPFCFVLMPFGSAFDDVYQLGIKEACTAAGTYCERVDEQIFTERILDRIYNQIAKADLIIADMTERNANVFYEVGYAHALGKITILLTQSADDIPFDLKHFPHIVYGGRITDLRQNLTQRVEWFVANRPESAVESQVNLELFLRNESLASGHVVEEIEKGHVPHCAVTLFNGSGQTIRSEEFRIGVITTPALEYSRGEGFVIIEQPDGNLLHMFPEFETLLPQQYMRLQISFEKSGHPDHEFEEAVVFRVFTAVGVRDFPLTFRRAKAASA